MGRYYDITNPDASYYWLHEVIVILPDDILEYIPAEKWRSNVLKDFGKA